MPERGRERSSSHATETLTFGPGFAFYALPPLALVFGSALLYADFHVAEPHPLALLFGSGMILTGLLFPIVAWARYRLDEEGMERRTVGSRRHWTWDEIGTVRGVELEEAAGSMRIDATAIRHTTTLIRRTVHDAQGRPLFRISPWTRDKRQLATQIRRRSTG